MYDGMYISNRRVINTFDIKGTYRESKESILNMRFKNIRFENKWFENKRFETKDSKANDF